MKLGLSAKLVISFGIIAVLLAVLALYSAIVSQKTLEESVERSSLIQVKEILTRIDQSIYYRIEELQKYSKGESLQRTLLESNADFEKLDSIEEYIKQKDQEWISVLQDEITPFMQKLINDDTSQILKREFIEFYEKKHGYKIFVQVLLTNRYGVNIAQTGKASNYRQDDEEWWKRAWEKGFSVSDAYYDEIYNTNCIKIGIRIDDENGNFIGVMQAIIAAEEIMREAEITFKEYETTKIKLITKGGKVIYATEPFIFLEDVTGRDFFKKLQEESGVFIIKEGGRKIIFSYAHSKGYRTFEGLQWILLINHNVEEVLSSAFILRNNILLFSLILVVTTILVAFLISRSIVSPVIKLRNITLEIAQGNLDKRIKISSKDEIGQLATAFNEMTSRLQESYINLKKEITSRKQTEKALQEAHDQLEGKVAQRTKELQKANLKLQELDQLKSMFIASMSHELRTPLNSIIGFTGIILQGMSGEINKEQRKQLTLVKNSANHLLDLINDVIDISKIEANKVELYIQEFDLSLLAQEIKESFAVVAEDKGLELSLKSPPTILIKSDERRTKQVLVNFIGNALKFTDKGEIEIKIVKKDKTAVISVRDTGIGINKEDIGKLFQAFSRITARGRLTEGTGLGLYLSKKITDLLGGDIKAESEFGIGSVFTLTLPLKR